MAIVWAPLLNHVHCSSGLRELLCPWMDRSWRWCSYGLGSGCWWCILFHLLICFLELQEVPALVQLVARFSHAVSVVETMYGAGSAQQLLWRWPFWSRLLRSSFLSRLLVSTSRSVVTVATVAVPALVAPVAFVTPI